MLKYAIFALITLELVLLSALVKVPANANIRVPEVFTWDYASISNTKVVCKKIVFHPTNHLMSESSDIKPVKVHSLVVNDSYCSHLTKPV